MDIPFLYLAGIVIFLKVQRLVIVSQSAHILRTLKVLNLDLPSPAINSNWNIKSWNSFIKFNNVHQLQPLFYRNIETSFIFQNVFMSFQRNIAIWKFYHSELKSNTLNLLVNVEVNFVFSLVRCYFDFSATMA